MDRDGFRLSNAELLTLLHLMNESLDPSHQSMSHEAVLRAFYILHDLLYVTSDDFLRLSQHLTHLRKLNAVRVLNLLDAKPFLESPTGPTCSEGMKVSKPQSSQQQSFRRSEKRAPEKERRMILTRQGQRNAERPFRLQRWKPAERQQQQGQRRWQ